MQSFPSLLPLHPTQVPNPAGLSRLVRTVESQHEKTNTKLAYDSKYHEFLEYCRHKQPDSDAPDRYTVTKIKLFEFLFYQAFREKRQKRRRAGSAGEFDASDFITVMDRYNPANFGSNVPVPEPTVGIGESAIIQYKCTVKRSWQTQVCQGINSLSWDQICTGDVETIIKMVKNRKERQKRKNFEEKVDNDSAALANPDSIIRLESWLYHDNKQAGARSVFGSLRNRFVFLHTVGGILRGESVYKAELSDLFGRQDKAAKDVHPYFVLVQQISTGKTNKGLKLYGRVMRHKEVSLCAIGALGFYLMYRFYRTGEMNPPPDFRDNEAWYHIKLLVSPNQIDYSKPVSDRTYMQAIQAACKHLNIPSNHWLHIGRVLGALELERMEDPSSEIRLLGNWDPSTQEKAYSAKVPMGIIRKKAWFRDHDGTHYNPRTSLDPPPELLRQVFPFADACLQELQDYETEFNERKPTATEFLKLLLEL